MRLARWIPVVILLSIVLVAGCNRLQKAPETGQGKLAATAYMNNGKAVEVIVDVRASRIAGNNEYLPLHLAVHNRLNDELVLNREDLVLELADGTRLPLASYEEFEKDHRRHRIDIRIGNDFIETLGSRYPAPPFQWRDLEFFPAMDSGTVPRTEIELRKAQIAVGLIYFRIPEGSALAGAGEATLLLNASHTGETYVVDVQAYKKPKS